MEREEINQGGREKKNSLDFLDILHKSILTVKSHILPIQPFPFPLVIHLGIHLSIYLPTYVLTKHSTLPYIQNPAFFILYLILTLPY